MYIVHARVACLGLEVLEHASNGQICIWAKTCKWCEVLFELVCAIDLASSYRLPGVQLGKQDNYADRVRNSWLEATRELSEK
jgi:hypothetical protein